jgi:hypothetical protein
MDAYHCAYRKRSGIGPMDSYKFLREALASCGAGLTENRRILVV